MIPKLLVVDDEATVRAVLNAMLVADGLEVTCAASFEEARQLLAQRRFDLVLTDHLLGDGCGIDVLKAVQDSDPAIQVIFLTGHATVELAVEAMQRGAADFLTKPFSRALLLTRVRQCLERADLMRRNLHLQLEVARRAPSELIGESVAMNQVRHAIQQVAPTNATVLILGETGTGKELVARGIHRASSRASRPFVAVNCGALPESLLESQLFGHERGAFTGADRARPGLFETAHGGTLFLDEAGDMTPGLQVKLLRALVDGEIVRVGGTSSRRVEVRVIAATNTDLDSAVRAGRFREDLYYRLAVFPIRVPALRERAEDIPILCDHLLRLVGADLGIPARRLSPEAEVMLRRYWFPGNIRELRNLLERASILATGALIQIEDLGISPLQAARPDLDNELFQQLEAGRTDLRTLLDAIEGRLIEAALLKSNGVQASAARLLGISRSDLSYKLGRRREQVQTATS